MLIHLLLCFSETPLGLGDSGSIVYEVRRSRESRNEKFRPLGMFVSIAAEDPFDDNTTYYQAVILSQAFDDIAETYHIQDGIHLFGMSTRLNTRRGARPPL